MLLCITLEWWTILPFTVIYLYFPKTKYSSIHLKYLSKVISHYTCPHYTKLNFGRQSNILSNSFQSELSIMNGLHYVSKFVWFTQSRLFQTYFILIWKCVFVEKVENICKLKAIQYCTASFHLHNQGYIYSYVINIHQW